VIIPHIQQPAGSLLCGQTCVAIAAGVTLDDAIKTVGHDHATRRGELVRAFKKFGIEAKGTRLQLLKRTNGRGDPLKAPEHCLLHVLFHKKGEPFHGHWVLRWNGVIHDPCMANASCWDANGRFASYIELIPPSA
jgi:hypothetical protein